MKSVLANISTIFYSAIFKDAQLTHLPSSIEFNYELDYDDDYEGETEVSDTSSSSESSPPTEILYSFDDLAAKQGPAPTEQVDYLSHEWQEPDIWLSRRYFRNVEAGYSPNVTRLENASWRSWTKSRYELKTIAPEALNWYVRSGIRIDSSGRKIATSFGCMDPCSVPSKRYIGLPRPLQLQSQFC
jgi:hypothetical protein